MQGENWLATWNIVEKTGALLAQGRMYEWHWEMHPMWWWGWGIGMMAMMFLFWVLFIVGLIVGIRWLIGKRQRKATGFGARDPASEIRARRDQQRRVRGQEERSRRMTDRSIH